MQAYFLSFFFIILSLYIPRKSSNVKRFHFSPFSKSVVRLNLRKKIPRGKKILFFERNCRRDRVERPDRIVVELKKTFQFLITLLINRLRPFLRIVEKSENRIRRKKAKRRSNYGEISLEELYQLGTYSSFGLRCKRLYSRVFIF